MVAWKGFFYMKSDADGATVSGSVQNLPAIFRSMGILITYTIVFVWSAIWVFRKKDILS